MAANEKTATGDGTTPIKWELNHLPKTNQWGSVDYLKPEDISKVLTFHASFPQYGVTPLVKLPNLARMLGLGGVYVKDESHRFGLNAFKALGGSYAMAKYVWQRLGRDESTMTYDALLAPDVKKELGEVTFFTATDGNHGRGVAWAARIMNQRCVVYMPKGTAKVRFDNIRKEGANVTVTEMNYDGCVRLASENAAKIENGVVVQDTAWEGYEEIPKWITQGYGTLMAEAAEQLQTEGRRPTHVFVQAGVGSMAAAAVGYFANLYEDNPPAFVVVESDLADCFYHSAVAGDGAARMVSGDMQTLMAGLACGEPSILAWDAFKNHVAAFVSIPDFVAAKGMRVMGNPLRGDQKVISGESGAAAPGFLYEMMTNDAYKPLQEALKLNDKSVLLLISTEGDTDPEKYLDVVWNGSNEKS